MPDAKSDPKPADAKSDPKPEPKPAKAKSEPTPRNAGPSTPVVVEPSAVDPAELLVTDLAPQVGEDGRVYVSDAISEAAVAEGYEPDKQPRNHPDEQPQPAPVAEPKENEEDK